MAVICSGVARFLLNIMGYKMSVDFYCTSCMRDKHKRHLARNNICDSCAPAIDAKTKASQDKEAGNETIPNTKKSKSCWREIDRRKDALRMESLYSNDLGYDI